MSVINNTCMFLNRIEEFQCCNHVKKSKEDYTNTKEMYTPANVHCKLD